MFTILCDNILCVNALFSSHPVCAFLYCLSLLCSFSNHPHKHSHSQNNIDAVVCFSESATLYYMKLNSTVYVKEFFVRDNNYGLRMLHIYPDGFTRPSVDMCKPSNLLVAHAQVLLMI